MSDFTSAITAEWLADEGNKFVKYNISPEALAMINRSETLKTDMRAYQASGFTAAGKVNRQVGTGEYVTRAGEDKGHLHIAPDRFNTPENTVSVLAHELGHFRVEEPDAAMANARAHAMAAKDKVAYENACHLTEGYARYNEVRVRKEILETQRLAAELEQRPLTEQELQLESRWRGEGVWASRPEGQDHLIASRIADAAREEPGHLTTTQVMEKAAFELAQNNKGYVTSSTGQSYSQFCEGEAARMLPGATVPVAGEALRTPPSPSSEPSPTEDLSAFLDRMLAADNATFRRMQQTLADLPPGREVIAEGIAEVDRQEQMAAQQQQQQAQRQAAPVMLVRH